jgi:SAM-dependent methyltransferase
VPRPYNVTDLDPQRAFERNVFHRDQFAHYLRWTFVLNRAKFGDTFVDFGCGNGNMLEVLYRNKFRPGYYLGMDIRESTMRAATEKFSGCRFPVAFQARDLVDPDFDIEGIVDGAEWNHALDETIPKPTSGAPTHVTCFEVVEHVGTQRVPQFLENLRSCGDDDTTYYLSTPNFDPHANQKGGAAGNHQYDSGDGRGVAIHEWDHDELNALIENSGFEIVEEFGTFASKKDYWPTLTDEDKALYDRLKRYYDANLVSNIMAPLVPARLGRNAIRVMKRS